MSTVISVENVSKQYRLGEVGTGSIAHDMNRWWHKVRGKEDPYLMVGEANDRAVKGNSDYAWALKDISFEVKQGELLGIIGRNGAGKSTLLKILSRVTQPTTGHVKIKGRIASLLEVGTGFHPELTGKENIYLNGAILGMRREEITRKLDEIIDFSGCERYIDTPVKRYSSGMYVRLAFAVAAHLDSEILILDEVLAVGDAKFQEKCIGRMNQVASAGRTVLFVSHNMQAVRSLCPRSIFLVNGEVKFSGSTSEAIEGYMEDGVEAQGSEQAWPDPADAPRDEVFRLRRVIAFNKDSFKMLYIHRPVFIDIDFDMLRSEEKVSVSIHLHTGDICAFVGGTEAVACDPGSYRATCEIPPDLLNNATYFVSVYLITDVTNFRLVVKDVINFSTDESQERGEYLGKIIGTVRPHLKWETIRIA